MWINHLPRGMAKLRSTVLHISITSGLLPSDHRHFAIMAALTSMQLPLAQTRTVASARQGRQTPQVDPQYSAFPSPGHFDARTAHDDRKLLLSFPESSGDF